MAEQEIAVKPRRQKEWHEVRDLPWSKTHSRLWETASHEDFGFAEHAILAKCIDYANRWGRQADGSGLVVTKTGEPVTAQLLARKFARTTVEEVEEALLRIERSGTMVRRDSAWIIPHLRGWQEDPVNERMRRYRARSEELGDRSNGPEDESVTSYVTCYAEDRPESVTGSVTGYGQTIRRSDVLEEEEEGSEEKTAAAAAASDARARESSPSPKPTSRRTAISPDAAAASEIVEIWNSGCAPLPKVEHLSELERSMLLELVRADAARAEIDFWRDFTLKASRAEFLSKKRGAPVTLGWFLEDEGRVVKLMRGDFDELRREGGAGRPPRRAAAVARPPPDAEAQARADAARKEAKEALAGIFRLPTAAKPRIARAPPPRVMRDKRQMVFGFSRRRR